MFTNAVVGNESCSKRLADCYSQFGNWLFVGPPGIGKATLAENFASWLLPSCASDLCVLRNKNGAIGVDAIREIGSFTSNCPSKGAWKVVIIDSVRSMTYSAVNALLKVLEEHPDYVIFFIIADFAFMVPGTISSRCQQLKFNYLNDDVMNEFVRRKGLSIGQGDLMLSKGSPGILVKLLENDGVVLYQNILEGWVCKAKQATMIDSCNTIVNYIVQIMFLRMLKYSLKTLREEVFPGEFALFESIDYNKFSVYERYMDFLTLHKSAEGEHKGALALLSC